MWFSRGLSVEETARLVNVSPDTVIRDWRLAKAWPQGEEYRAFKLPRRRSQALCQPQKHHASAR